MKVMPIIAVRYFSREEYHDRENKRAKRLSDLSKNRSHASTEILSKSLKQLIEDRMDKVTE